MVDTRRENEMKADHKVCCAFLSVWNTGAGGKGMSGERRFNFLCNHHSSTVNILQGIELLSFSN